MEDGNNLFCSQTFFVSQRVKKNKLSLRAKAKKPKVLSGDSLMNQKISLKSLYTPVDADKYVRTDSLESSLTEMEKYFGKLSSNSSSTLKDSATGDSGSEMGAALEKKLLDKYAVRKSNGDQSNLKQTAHSVSGIMSTERTLKIAEETMGDHLISGHISNDGCNGDVPDCIVNNVIPVSEIEEKEEAELYAFSSELVSKTGETNILLCPLCLKSFDSKETQFSHMKLCAGKNNVSTKQLLDALKLVQRQEAERKSLGLPLIVSKIPKKCKKVASLVSSIRPKNALEGSIQLGLALSASLEESEKQKERDHLLEAGLFNEAEEKGLLPIQAIEENEPLPTAPIFLNVRQKSADGNLDGPKTCKKNSKFIINGKIPALFKRTAEEREQLITEKVAIILVNGNINRDNNLNLNGGKNNDNPKISSDYLKKLINKENTWWNLTSFSSSSESDDKYYVTSLPHVRPVTVDAEKKSKDISCMQAQKTPDKSPAVYLSDSMIKAKWNSASPVVPSCSSKEDVVKPSDKKSVTKALFVNNSEPVKINSLSRDWSTLVGRRQMSDITVYTKDGCEIPAHRLVFYVRCPEVLNELVEVKSKGEQVSYMLMWTDTCYVAAMKFLRYVYTDVFIDSAALCDNELKDLKNLSNRYDMKDLVSLLNKIPYSSDLCEIQSISCHSEVFANRIEKDNLELHESSVNNRSKEETKKSLSLANSDGNGAQNETVKSSSLPPIANELGRYSPDLFQPVDIINSPASVEIIEEKLDNSEFDRISQDSRESIEYLVSLMEDSSFNESDNTDQQKAQTIESTKDSESAASDQNNRCMPEKNDRYEIVIGPSTPKTPSCTITSEFLVNSTPAPEKLAGSTNFDSLFEKKKSMDSCDVKRKCKSSDDSETSLTPKKVRIIEKETDDKEIVLNESEEMDGIFNISEISTLPAPENEIHLLSPVIEKVNSSVVSQCNASYISNVWEGFDYISEPNVDVRSSPNESLERYSSKTENFSSEAILNRNQVLDKISDLPDETLSASFSKILKSPERTVLKDDSNIEKLNLSPIKSTQVSPLKEHDMTQQLLTASLQEIDNSLYWRDENEPSLQSKKSNTPSPCETPVKTSLCASSSKSKTPTNQILRNVTPLADYSAMKTPILHKELDRYGIKHLKRNQAKLLLRHIYNELHPMVPEGSNEAEKSSKMPDLNNKDKIKNQAKENKAVNKKKITFKSLDSSSEVSSSEESSDSSSDSVMLEESIYEPQFDSPVKCKSLSQRALCVDIPTAMKNLVESNPDIHKKILLYEPIWLNEIKIALKENGAKFNTNQLMNYLDEQCITFRFAQGNNHQRRRKKSKKTFSLSQPCGRRKKNDQSISGSQPC